MTSYDAIVVGAGPAGSTAARLLARQGFHVLMLDKARFPRQKPCGGALSPKAYRQLDFDISHLVKSRIANTLMKGPGGNSFVLSSGGAEILVVDRQELDTCLLQRAAEAGVHVQEDEAAESVGSGGTIVSTARASYRTMALIGADGCHSVIARAVGLLERRLWFRALHVEAPAHAGHREEAILDFRHPRGYAWLFPKGDRFNAGVCSRQPGWDLRPALVAFLKREGVALNSADCYHAWPIPVGARARKLHRGNTILVGDAAGLADPLLGEGVAYALMSGRLAADAVASYLRGESEDLARYSETMGRTLFKDLSGVASAASLLYRLPLLLLYLLRSCPALKRLALSVLSGERSRSNAWVCNGPNSRPR